MQMCQKVDDRITPESLVSYDMHQRAVQSGLREYTRRVQRNDTDPSSLLPCVYELSAPGAKDN